MYARTHPSANDACLFIIRNAYCQFWLVHNSGTPERCAYNPKFWSKRKHFENPEISKMEQIRQNLYDGHQKLYKRYSRTAKSGEEATNAPLVPVSMVEWVISLRTKRNKRRLGKI